MKTMHKKEREYDRALWIGAHFGFTPIDAPRIKEVDRASVLDCEDNEVLSKRGRKLFDPVEKAAFLRVYQDKDFASLPHPLSVSYKHEGNKKTCDYSFELAGFTSGTAEALLIRTALSVLIEEGHKNLVVELNSIGDKDSISAYEKELHNYARKIATELNVDLRKRIKKNVFELISIVSESAALKEKLPSSIGSLSPQSRAQFKEVIEHIDMLGAEFRLLPSLVGNKHFCSDTLFAIRDTDKDEVCAVGYRYSRLSKKVGFKKEISLAGVTVFAGEMSKKYKDLPKPKFYLVQLGQDAKMKSLPLIELLRNHHVPIHHSLGDSKITGQLGTAETLQVPYLMIVGQKEAIEDSVTIRNTSTRAQDTIAIRDLPKYLKKLPF